MVGETSQNEDYLEMIAEDETDNEIIPARKCNNPVMFYLSRCLSYNNKCRSYMIPVMCNNTIPCSSQ